MNKGEVENALLHYQKALGILNRSCVFGHIAYNHPDVAASYNNLEEESLKCWMSDTNWASKGVLVGFHLGDKRCSCRFPPLNRHNFTYF
jgi:hypothetical protein